MGWFESRPDDDGALDQWPDEWPFPRLRRVGYDARPDRRRQRQRDPTVRKSDGRFLGGHVAAHFAEQSVGRRGNGRRDGRFDGRRRNRSPPQGETEVQRHDEAAPRTQRRAAASVPNDRRLVVRRLEVD